jgi:hypothetical protein
MENPLSRPDNGDESRYTLSIRELEIDEDHPLIDVEV